MRQLIKYMPRIIFEAWAELRRRWFIAPVEQQSFFDWSALYWYISWELKHAPDRLIVIPRRFTHLEMIHATAQMMDANPWLANCREIWESALVDSPQSYSYWLEETDDNKWMKERGHHWRTNQRRLNRTTRLNSRLARMEAMKRTRRARNRRVDDHRP